MKRLKKNILCTIINTQPIETMRYPTVGDWLEPMELGMDDTVLFEVKTADTGNLDYNFLIALHEMVEQYLCYRNGITDEKVTEFDKAHLGEDPGLNSKAPYHEHHMTATEIEAIMATALGVNWVKYEDVQEKLLKKYDKKKKNK